MALGCPKCYACKRCRSSWDDDEAGYFAAGHQRARRPILDNFPAPTPPTSWGSSPSCWFCLRDMGSVRKRNLHAKSCMYMPIKMWLARARMLTDPGPDRYPCFHSGTDFDHSRSRASHMKYCSKRRVIAQIPLNSDTYLPSSRYGADVPRL